ncbi:TPA: oligosaccharide repeat unit polymerase [Photobacterium damselae]
MISLLYVVFLLITMTISFVFLLKGGYYPGELSPFTIQVTGLEIFFWYFVNFLSVLLLFFLYKLISKYRIVIGYSIDIKYQKLNYLMSALLIINLLFIINTGVGVVGSHTTSPFTPLVFFLKPDTFFYIYFLIFRPKIGEFKIIFIINIVLFCLLKFSQGWSGFVFLLFFIELYYRFNQISIKKIIYIMIAPFLIILLGGGVYSKVYVLKNEIRGNDVDSISFYEGVEHLANRLSYLPITIGGVQNKEKIIDLYQSDGYQLKEFKSVLRPLVPSVLFKNKDFRTLNNVVMQSYYPNITKSTSSNFGLPLYIYLLYSISPLDAFLYIGLVIIFVFLMKLTYDIISPIKGQLNFLFLLGVMNLGSLEVSFSYSFFSNITFIVIAIVIGAFKITRTS